MNITPSATDRLVTARAAGAFGEWAVVVELLRRGWIPANVNQTVKNNDGFDILAQKGNRRVSLSVKTRRSHVAHFQIGGFSPGVEIQSLPYSDSDFTILVGMAEKRAADQFYVVPSHRVREECQLVRQVYLSTLKRSGQKKKDIGHYNLVLADVGKRYGNLEERWKRYFDNWQSLEQPEAQSAAEASVQNVPAEAFSRSGGFCRIGIFA
jgi:hypothetical protein